MGGLLLSTFLVVVALSKAGLRTAAVEARNQSAQEDENSVLAGESEAGPLIGGRVDAAPVAESPTPNLRSRESILAEYWGPEYDSVREAALAAGIDLDMRVVPPPPWEEVEEQARQHFVLDAVNELSLRRAYLNEEPALTFEAWAEKYLNLRDKSLDAIAIGDLEAIKQKHEPAVEEAFSTYFMELDSAVNDLWVTQRYRKGPIFLPRGEMAPMVKAAAFQVSGWSVSWIVRSDEYPHLDVISTELQNLVWDRDREMQEYINGL